MQSQNGPQYDFEEKSGNGSKFPKIALTARVVTIVSLVVSVAVLKTNDGTLDNGYVYTYKSIRSYKYMFFVALFGIGYTLLQIPFAIYYMKRKKHLINSFSFLRFEFYADKTMAILLATGAGAAFGATLDLKKVNWLHDKTQIDDFLTVGYIPSAFALVGCLGCLVSSVHSSLPLTKA